MSAEFLELGSVKCRLSGSRVEAIWGRFPFRHVHILAMVCRYAPSERPSSFVSCSFSYGMVDTCPDFTCAMSSSGIEWISPLASFKTTRLLAEI